MSRSCAVENVEAGDNAVVWFQAASAPEAVVVCRITEAVTFRTLHCNLNGQPLEISVPRGHTIDLAC